jgi:nucleotide-binding universal stress UspA family protein
MERILVATDGSEGADRAVDFAARLATAPQAHLLILSVAGLHALPDAVLAQFTRSQHAWMRDRLAEHSAKILQQARDRAAAAGAAAIQLETRDGEVTQMIVDLASVTAADAIVVGKRGTGRLTGLLLGSVSQKLVSISPLPVIVVP